MSEVVQVAGFTLKEVSIDEFLEVVSHSLAGDLVHQYNALTSYGASGAFGDIDNSESDSTYERVEVPLQEPSLDNVVHQILDQTTRHSFIGNREDLIEQAALESLENYGTPTHLVKIYNNIYGVFCVEDFKAKVYTMRKSAVVCHAPRRNIVFNIGANDEFIFERSGAV